MGAFESTSDRTLQFELQCYYSAVRSGAIQLRAFLQGLKVEEEEIWALELAFVEGCNNAVRHAPLARYNRPIQVQIGCENGLVEMRIADATAGFDLPDQIELPPPSSESGRGIYLIQNLMDQVNYVRQPDGNCLILQRKLRS